MASKEKLVVYDHHSLFRIGWWIPEDQEVGATLGEDIKVDDLPADDDHAIAVRLILSLEYEVDNFGFYWESKSAASRVLRLIKDRLNNKEYPDWAKMALAEGWKPPKNWKP